MILFFNELLEKTVLGNAIIDDLDITSLDKQDFYFDENRKIYEALIEIKKEGHALDTIVYKASHYGVNFDLISECTDHGVVTINFIHNVETLKKITNARFLKKLGEILSTTDYNDLDKQIKTIKKVMAKVEKDSTIDDMKVFNPDIQPCRDYKNIQGYIPTGFKSLDDALNDLVPAGVTLVTGRSFEGKTTFVRQIAANAIETQNKVLWVMGENLIQNELDRLYQLIIGANTSAFDTVKVNKRYLIAPKPHILEALKRWHSNKLKIIHKSEAKLKSTDELFNLLEKQVIRDKPNLIIIDNLMSVLTTTAVEKNEKQADFMQRCSDLSKLYSLHIILVLHPSKLYRKGKQMEFEEISGTSDLPNKADNILVVRKNHDDDKDSDDPDGYIDIIKNKLWGDTLTVETKFDYKTQSLIEIIGNKAVRNVYSFEKYIEKSLEIKEEFIQQNTMDDELGKCPF